MGRVGSAPCLVDRQSLTEPVATAEESGDLTGRRP
jgi:hypothetical protein